MLFPPERRNDAALLAIARRMAADTGAETFLRQQRAIMGRPDSRPDLPAIRVPTLVGVGEEDSLTPPELAEEMAAGIPGARLVRIPDAGHLPPMEQPDAVTKLLREWLAG